MAMGNPLKNRCFNGKNTEKNIQKPFEALQDKLQKLKTGFIRGLEMDPRGSNLGAMEDLSRKSAERSIKHIGILGGVRQLHWERYFWGSYLS